VAADRVCQPEQHRQVGVGFKKLCLSFKQIGLEL